MLPGLAGEVFQNIWQGYALKPFLLSSTLNFKSSVDCLAFTPIYHLVECAEGLLCPRSRILTGGISDMLSPWRQLGLVSCHARHWWDFSARVGGVGGVGNGLGT